QTRLEGPTHRVDICAEGGSMQNQNDEVSPLNSAQQKAVDHLRGVLTRIDNPQAQEEILDAWEELCANMTSSTQRAVLQELDIALTDLRRDAVEKLATLL